MPDSEAGRSDGVVAHAASGAGETGRGASVGLLWGVGAVSARLDIARPTLRTWDRRYGLGPSLRTAGGHRRYTDTDVARVQMMNRLLDTGVVAAQAAQLACTATEDELAAMLRPVQARRRQVGSQRRASSAVAGLVREARNLRPDELARGISVQLHRRGPVQAWDQVFAPFLIEMGLRWSEGKLGIESEHLASGVLTSELRAFSTQHRSRRPARARVIAACAEDEQHVLPVVALEAALAERKIPVLMLGQRLPATALRQAVLARQPSVVFVWASVRQAPAADSAWQLDPEVPLHVLLGGPGWEERATRSRDPVHVERVHDLESTVVRIERLLQS